MPNPPEEATACDLSPLALLLQEMRERYKSNDKEGAVALARIAAPYLHSRLRAAIPAADLAALTDADLDKLRPPE